MRPLLAKDWTDGCTGEWATPVAALPNDDDETIARLATMPLLDYERVRKDQAAKLGVHLHPLLDKLVNAERLRETSVLQGSAVELADIKPWARSGEWRRVAGSHCRNVLRAMLSYQAALRWCYRYGAPTLTPIKFFNARRA